MLFNWNFLEEGYIISSKYLFFNLFVCKLCATTMSFRFVFAINFRLTVVFRPHKKWFDVYSIVILYHIVILRNFVSRICSNELKASYSITTVILRGCYKLFLVFSTKCLKLCRYSRYKSFKSHGHNTVLINLDMNGLWMQ